MKYETIREARLRHPFRPFYIKTTDGRVFFIRDEVHLVVAPKVVALYDAAKDEHEMLTPSDVERIVYADHPLGVDENGR